VSPVEQVLGREQLIIASGLAGLIGLAWLYLWWGAGMGMTGLDMTTLTLLPHRQPETMAGMEPVPFAWVTAVVMWWTMMIAMMTPGARRSCCSMAASCAITTGNGQHRRTSHRRWFSPRVI
jgi:predicted metal-binding membrane protein